jgi:hypothetical protein
MVLLIGLPEIRPAYGVVAIVEAHLLWVVSPHERAIHATDSNLSLLLPPMRASHEA